jgi:hypothetical protein
VDVSQIVTARIGSWRSHSPAATEDQIAGLRKAAPFVLPAEYVELLKVTNGGEGELALEPGWFQIWPAHDVQVHNTGYRVSDFHPGFWGFGSSGGGVMFAFRGDRNAQATVFGVPFDSIDPKDIRVVAQDFHEFLLALGRPNARAV